MSTEEQKKKQRQGYEDATTHGNRDKKLDGDSWYEQGWMEGKINKVEWAADELKRTFGRLSGTTRPIPAAGVEVQGFRAAMTTFFSMLAVANGIKEDTQHFSYELQWEQALESIAAEYVALNKK